MKNLRNVKDAQTKTTKTNSKLKGLAFLQFALLMISMPSAMAVTPPPTPTVTSVTVDGASSLSCAPSDCEDKKVVITGTNFDSSFTVLGFAAGSIKSCSRDNNSQITCTLAKLLANSSNNIKVKNTISNKTAATGVNFPITVLTTPTVTSITVDGASSLSCTPSDCEDKKVIITGTNFDSSFTVLGFAAGSIKSCSRDNNSQITCTLAKLLANSSNNIKVKNVSTNKTAATSVNFPITVLAPTVTSISPASIADCANIDVQISVSNLDPSPSSYDFGTSLPVTGCTYAGSGKLNCKSTRSSLTANKSLSAIVLKETFASSPANKVFSSAKYTTPFAVTAVPLDVCTNTQSTNTTVTGAASALPAESATTKLETGASQITVTGVTASVPSCGGSPKVTISGSGFNLSSFERGSSTTPSSKDNIAVKALNSGANIFSSCTRVTNNSIDCYIDKNSLPATKKGLTVQLGKKITKTVGKTSSLVSLASQTAKFDYYALSNDACASLPLSYPYLFNISSLSCYPSECENKSIVITGKNFASDASVLGFAAGIIKSCTRNSSTQISCITDKLSARSIQRISVKNLTDNQTTDVVNVPILVLPALATDIAADGRGDINCLESNNYCKDKPLIITGINFDSGVSVSGFSSGIVKYCTKNSNTQITCILNSQNTSSTYKIKVANNIDDLNSSKIQSLDFTINVLQNNDTKTYSNWCSPRATAELRADGTVVTWGNNVCGGDSSAVQSQLNNVTQIYPSAYGFAALKADGTVVTWGHPNSGGDSSSVQNKLNNVVQIYSNALSFAALKSDGTVVTWGDGSNGGDSSSVQNKLNNVIHIYTNNYFNTSYISFFSSYAALKADGTVVTWGNNECGGDSSIVQSQLNNVIHIYSDGQSYVALKADGTVVTWGAAYLDGSKVQSKLNNVIQILAGYGEWVALKADGTVVIWGGYNSAVQSQLNNVNQIIQGPSGSWAALKADGTVVTWGNVETGGDSSAVQSQLNNVIEIRPKGQHLEALKADGTIVTWGGWYE